MTFTGRIRLYLIGIALLPPLLIITFIYFHSIRQAEHDYLKDASGRVQQFLQFNQSYQDELFDHLQALPTQPEIRKAILMIQSGHIHQIHISPEAHGVDFLEILDSNRTVLVSGHRPGLIGESMAWQYNTLLETVEYDINGPHAANASLLETNDGYYIYGGLYLDEGYRSMLARITGTEVVLSFSGDSMNAIPDLRALEKHRLMEHDDSFYILLAGGEEIGFYLTATFAGNPDRPLFLSLVKITAIVALVAILAAIAFGMYITGRAKREIENLISATSRIAAGDYNTPVMAYEEGEFSQLADSFSDMTIKLKDTQRRLATSEKIAAWKAIGQKVAHELKNPLTPIAISADDLRRSFNENHADFEIVLNETTAIIKSEVQRMTTLIDEFAGFARMGAPKIVEVSPNTIIDGIIGLYAADIDTGRLAVSIRSKRKRFHLDPDQIQQVLINIIKNGLATGESTTVIVTVRDNAGQLQLVIEDNGQGFPPEILQTPFVPYVSNRPGGSGLGLVICQRIIHDHGGTISLYNRKEGGAGVVIDLPQNHGQNSDNR